jgi:hypothetical protein
MTDPYEDDDPGAYPNEATYEDVDENGQVPQTKERRKSMKESALSPKTPLQTKALFACRGRQYFSTTAQRKLFQKIEAKAIGADPQSRLWAAWMDDRIKWAAKYRWSIEQLVNSIQSKPNYDKWQSKYRNQVLAKPTIDQLTGLVENRMKELQHGDFDE